MSSETGSDDLWIAEKFQSNSEIAGSPRNSFRASLGKQSRGGRALIGCGARKGYQAQSNSECHRLTSGSQTVSAKIHCQKGNSPDHQLRSPSVC